MAEADTYEGFPYIVYARLASEDRSEATKDLAIKGVRAARNVLGDKLGATAKRAEATVMALGDTDGPQPIGGCKGQQTALDAVGAAGSESNGMLVCEVILDHTAPQEAAGSAGNSDLNDEAGVRVYKIEICDDCGSETNELEDGAGACQHNGKTHFEDAVLVSDVESELASVNPFSWEACACALITLAACSGTLSLPSKTNTYMNNYVVHAPDAAVWIEAKRVLATVFPGPAAPTEMVDPSEPEPDGPEAA